VRLAGLIAAATLAAAPTAAFAQAIPIALNPGEVLLSVDADGQHLDRPDVMSITAGVVTTARTAKGALDANAVLANRLLQAVRAAGLAPRDIRTDDLRVTPQYAKEEPSPDDEEEGVRRIVGYVAHNRLNLQLRDLAKAPAVIDALFAAGANEVRGPHFSLSDPKPAIRAARLSAVAEARVEADTYAEALGMRIVRALRVSERQSFEADESNYIVVTGSRIPATPVEPGEIATRVRVWVDYAMVPR
jgi:uncharacterized protein YggE